MVVEYEQSDCELSVFAGAADIVGLEAGTVLLEIDDVTHPSSDVYVEIEVQLETCGEIVVDCKQNLVVVVVPLTVIVETCMG